jgi:hypothetical protein
MMGFVTLEDMTGNIELVIFPKTWEKFRPLCEDGKVILAIGKLDTATTPPKVLVDEIRTDFTMYVSADSGGAFGDMPEQPPAMDMEPFAAVTPVRTAPSRQTTAENNPQTPARTPTPVSTSSAAQPVRKEEAPRPAAIPARIAQTAPDYVPEPPELDGDMPPEPDAPPDWEQFAAPASTHFSAPTPMDDMLEIERLVPAVENRKAPEAIQPAQAQEAATFAAPSLPPIAPPLLDEPSDNGLPPRLITIILRPSGDNERDRRRIKNVYGILISAHGKDRFQFQVFENGRGHLIDFPNDTTRIAPDMLNRLQKLIGEETWRIEDIMYQ